MTVRQNYRPNLTGIVPPAAAQAIGGLYDAISDHDQAINLLSAKGAATATMATSTAATVASSTAATASASATSATTTSASVAGSVSVQTADYTAQGSNNNGLVVVNSPSPVTVTLNSSLAANWMGAIENLGAGTVTIMPGMGQINGASSLPLMTGAGVSLYFDGTNFYANTPPGASGTINGDLTVTGVFTASNPADTSVIAGSLNIEQTLSVAGGISIEGGSLIGGGYNNGATPTIVFDGGLGQLFEPSLVGNVTSSTFQNLAPGLLYVIRVLQAATGVGPYTLAWPTLLQASSPVSTTASSVSQQLIVALDRTSACCVGPLQVI